jgi:hypothetical protein
MERGMKPFLMSLLIAFPVVLSEGTAAWWTQPDAQPTGTPPLNLKAPTGPEWTVNEDLFRQVQPSLQCNDGWIADEVQESGPGMRLAYFAWDETSTVNTLEAFKHLPEQCMGSIGMKLEKTYPARLYQVGNHTLHFDSTQFRPNEGGMVIHIFKCVWVTGLDNPNLREGIVWGGSGLELRRLRIAAAATRFKPRHTRVMMGAVPAMPSEALAWHQFSREILERLSWQGEPPRR